MYFDVYHQNQILKGKKIDSLMTIRKYLYVICSIGMFSQLVSYAYFACQSCQTIASYCNKKKKPSRCKIIEHACARAHTILIERQVSRVSWNHLNRIKFKWQYHISLLFFWHKLPVFHCHFENVKQIRFHWVVFFFIDMEFCFKQEIIWEKKNLWAKEL